MRQIKFRLSKDGKTVGYERHILDPLRVCIEYSADNEKWHPINIFKIKHDHKSQFISLLDKNKIEIYEDDILRFPDFHRGHNPKLNKNVWDMLGVVTWYEGINPNPMFKIKTIGDGQTWHDNWCYSKEVIGNRFENPELLEGE